MKKWIFVLLISSSIFSCGQSGTQNAAIGSFGDTDTVKTVQEPEKKFTPSDIVIEKDLQYNQHTLADSYPYKDTVRVFQFDKMRDRLYMLDSIQLVPSRWAVLQNRRNVNGEAALVKEWQRNAYNNVSDMNGVQRYQSVPLYVRGESDPTYYGHDGSLVKYIGMGADSSVYYLESYNAPGQWEVPEKYVKMIDDGTVFHKAVMVDRTNQNITTLEKVGNKWLVRSMNPATTGVHNPPYAHETPQGLFVVQEKKDKMYYTRDGTSDIVGYAPWASRFSNGAYLHGVPTNSPSGAIIEFSSTLGTIPRSHMCVRNASSHAKFIYDWAPVEQAVVFVYD